MTDVLPIEYESLQSIISSQFGLFVSKFKPAHFDGYIGQSQYNEIVNVFMSRSIYSYFSFDKIITIDNGKVVTMLNSPVIQSILDDINKTLHVTEGMRFTNDRLTYIPILPNVKPWLVFKYNNELDFINIDIKFSVIHEGGDHYELTTKNTSIQNPYEPSGFKKTYSMRGELIQDELASYHHKMLSLWGISQDENNIDYLSLGVLSDMINI